LDWNKPLEKFVLISMLHWMITTKGERQNNEVAGITIYNQNHKTDGKMHVMSFKPL